MLLRKTRFLTKLKRKYFHMCIGPTLLYGCSTWALTKKTEIRIATCQQHMERAMLGIRLRDKKPLTWIRQITKLKDMVSEARRRKWQYAQKVMIRNPERWDRRLLEWTPPGTRPLGRPRTRWTDYFNQRAGPEWKSQINTAQWLSNIPPLTRW